MTNYNDGKWHGWNGGECPVHPKSVVQIVWQYADGSIRDGEQIGPSGEWVWLGNEHGKIVAFRVVKEYREPRECWAYLTHMFDSIEGAEAFRAQLDANHPGNGYLDTPITHWREVV